MKKFLLYILFILLSFTTVQAQKSETRFRLGLKAAPSVSWLKPDATGLKSGDVALKFAYGLITEFGIGKNYSFATGVDVSYTGGNLSFDSTVYNSSKGDSLIARKFKLQYIEIPLTLKMKTNQIGYMTYYAQFGINASVKLKVRADDKDAAGKVVNDVDINNDLGMFRVALNVGAGVEWNFSGNTSLVFGLTYNNGFTNILPNPSNSLINPKTGAAIAQKANTNYIALTVGVLF